MRDKEQLPQGEQTFHMRTGLPPVRGKEKVSPPTEEEANAANTGAYAESTKTVEKVGRNRVLKAVLGGSAVVAGGAIAYEAVPAVHRTVDSAFLDNLKGKFKLLSPPETQTTNSKKEVFDPTAIKGKISERSIVRLPQGEIDKQFPTAFGKLSDEGKTIISLAQPAPLSETAAAERVGKLYPDISFEVGPDKNTLQFQYPLDLRSSSNPNTQIKFKKSYSAFTQTDRDAFKDQGYYDTYDFYNIPKGTVIRMPLDGYLVLAIDGDVFINVQAPNGNQYSLLMGGRTTEDKRVPLKPLVDVPMWTPELNGKPIGTVGSFAPTGKPVFQTTEKLDRFSFRILSAVKAKGEPVQTGNVSNIVIPTNIEFFLSPDNQLLASDQ